MPIAIVGMACLFPEAHDLREFWDNVVKKRDCISDVPPSRWRIEDYYDADRSAPDKTYSKRGGFIPDIDFDPVEFGLPPNSLEVTDSSQLLALFVAKRALEDAGYGSSGRTLDRERTGVVLGVGGGLKLITPLTARLQGPVWEEAMLSSGLTPEDARAISDKIRAAYIPWEENSFPGMLGNVISGRVANRLDLGGINCTVDAACASSLAGLRLALAELESGRADTMLAGGVDADNSPFMYMCFAKTPAFTGNDRPRPFDAASDGMMVGEGIGVLVLRRLADAERDGDRVYAVIRGMGASSDGRFKSIYAPRGEGQERALVRAYADAGVDLASVGLIEAHGTGTVAGDLVEVSTLRRVFEERGPGARVALGSVKSQIGHTKAAAGAAGLIKAALALHHKVLPPTINVDEPHPAGGFGDSPLYLNTEPRPWARVDHETPRRAGVSSFGFGGTNFHVVLEEYEPEQARPYRLHDVAQPILLSAATPVALAERCRQESAALAATPARLTALAAESNAPIAPEHARVGIVAESAAEGSDLLRLAAAEIERRAAAESWEHPRGIFYRREGLELDGRVAALFPGQGSQYVDMGRELALSQPELRDALARADALCHAEGDEPLSSVVYPPPSFANAEAKAREEALRRTDRAQPAIGALSAAIFRVLRQAGFAPDRVAGHSFGELTALWAAGALDDAAFAELALARGRAMAAPPSSGFDPGGMLAVKADEPTVGAALDGLDGLDGLPRVTVANVNGPSQVVVAGQTDALAAARKRLTAAGLASTPLPVAAAFHTPLVAHAQAPFAAAVAAARVEAPRVPVYANATAQPYAATADAVRDGLVDQLLQPVRFQQLVERLYADGARLFVEVGPRNVLTNLVDEILGDRPHVAVALNPSRRRDADRQLREALVRLRVCGLALDLRDPYAREREPVVKKTGGAVVRLNGSNYVSERTRAAHQAALENGHRVAQAQPAHTAPPPVDHAPTGLPPQSAFGRASTGTPPQPALGHAPVNASPQRTTMHPTSTTSVNASQQQTVGAASASATATSPNGAPYTPGSLAHAPAAAFTPEPAPMHPNAHNAQTGFPAPPAAVHPTQTAAPAHVPLVAAPVAPMLGTIERGLLEFTRLQGETLRAHQQYLADQGEQARAFLGFMQQQQELLLRQGATVPPEVHDTLARSMHMFHELQRETLHVHVRYLESQTAQATGYFAALTGTPSASAPAPQPYASLPTYPSPAPAHYAPPAPAYYPPQAPAHYAPPLPVSAAPYAPPAPTAPSPAVYAPPAAQAPTAPKAYPPPLPHAVPAAYAPAEAGAAHPPPALDQAPATPGPLTASGVQGAKPPAGSPGAGPLAREENPPSPIAMGEGAGGEGAPKGSHSPNSKHEVSTALLQVVSDKTGYPVDTLDPSMDLEADLGIDSIKRVEILGAMRERFPDAPHLKPEELAELRTLQQIVDYLATQTEATQTAPSHVEPTRSKPAGLSIETVTAGLLQVVSDKTGYPVDTLDPTMDLEADLGIDSIKRVEILGAMREQFPDAPHLKPEELAELRTLKQIVHYLAAHAPADGEAPLGLEPPEPTIDWHPVRLRQLPPPDLLEGTPPPGAACVLTDDGTALTDHVALRLESAGWRVARLAFPASLVPTRNGATVRLSGTGEPDLAAALDQIGREVGPIAAFVHLQPPSAGRPLVDDVDGEIARAVYFLAKALRAPLAAAEEAGARPTFAVVTRLDGQLGRGSTNGHGAVAGGLYGLVKTLALEWPAVHCRAVDLAPAIEPGVAADLVLAELRDPSRLVVEVGHGEGLRVTPVAVEEAELAVR